MTHHHQDEGFILILKGLDPKGNQGSCQLGDVAEGDITTPRTAYHDVQVTTLSHELPMNCISSVRYSSCAKADLAQIKQALQQKTEVLEGGITWTPPQSSVCNAWCSD